MSGEMPRVSVVVPAYNEGDQILPVLDRLFESVHLQCEVLVVVPGLYGDEATAVLHRVKVYMPKSTEAKEGDRVALYPTRYLVYADRAQPIEVRNQPDRTLDENLRNDLSRAALSTG